jgi:hypothetical protein
MRQSGLKISRAALLLVTLLLVTACEGVKIGDLNRDPSRYQGREVTITGRVVDSFGLLGDGAFQVDDGTGRIWVVSGGFGVPSNGLRVAVTGTATSGLTIAGRSFGNALRETHPRHDHK